MLSFAKSADVEHNQRPLTVSIPLPLTAALGVDSRYLADDDERVARRSMRFERAGLYAPEHGYDTISSSLGISHLQDMAQRAAAISKRAASNHAHVGLRARSESSSESV